MSGVMKGMVSRSILDVGDGLEVGNIHWRGFRVAFLQVVPHLLTLLYHST